MKKLLSLIILSTFCFAEVQTEGYVGLDFQSYSQKNSKHSSNFTLEQQLKLTYEDNDFSSVLEVFAQEDYSDTSNKKDNDRTFVRINEVYFQYEFEEDRILLGKNIRFWGALEVNNIVDTFNIQEGRNDPTRTDKIGAYNFEYSHYFEECEFSFIGKFYEQNRKMSESSYMYSTLQEGESLSDTLESEKSLYRPNLYLTYSGSLSEVYALDYAFVYQNGYDSQRYSTKSGDEYSEHSYIVNKFMTYNTLVIDSTLYKLEFAYVDVQDDNAVSDYFNLGLGVENTFEQLEDGSEIGLIGEYYYYQTLKDDKLSDLDLGQSFQNDLFLGLRYSMNDEADTSAVGGVILDTQYNEQNYYIEYESRFFDTFKVKVDARYIEPSTSHNTIFAKQGRQHRFGFNISYHF